MLNSFLYVVKVYYGFVIRCMPLNFILSHKLFMHCCNFLSLFDSKFPNSVQYFCTEMSPYALLKFQQWVLTSYWVAETILLKILLTQCGNSFEMSVEAGTLVINVQYGAGLCMYF